MRRNRFNLLTVVAWLACGLYGQAAATGRLTGRIVDAEGEPVAGARVTAHPRSGVAVAIVTGAQGTFQFILAPGTVRLSVRAPWFAPWHGPAVQIAAGQSRRLKITLQLATQAQMVTVRANQTARLQLAPAHNASAVVIQGKDLQDLSNDPDELLSQLAELAGPAAGPNGPTVYIDGFSGGDLPPKSAILAVRVNRNPFAASRAHLGYGRIEVLTKPGSEQLRGGASIQGNTSALNARSPFLAGATLPPYHTLMEGLHLGGPLGHKTSWFLAAQRRDINHDALIHAELLDPATLQPAPYAAAVAAPRSLDSASIRIDRQLTPNNALMLRYHYFSANERGSGVGGESLPSQASSFLRHHHLLQIADSQLLGPTGVNQLRLQILHFHNTQIPVSTAPTIEVLGAFTGGGAGGGTVRRGETHYQLLNITSMTAGAHQLQAGEAVRNIRRSESNTAGFNGDFIFDSLAEYQGTEQGRAGDGPSQFNLTAGNPGAAVSRWDAAVFAQDDWTLRRNFALSYGLRLETENYLHDHDDWAPRFGFAWGLGRNFILRAGTGVFYDRLDDDQMIVADRYNGLNQTIYQVANPSFYPTVPPPSALAGGAVAPTVYLISPELKAPYSRESAASLERQLGRRATLSLTYLNSRGERQFLTNDINAPLPGSYNPAVPSAAVRPLGNAAGNIYAYESAGIFRQNQLIANVNVRGQRFSWFGAYTYNDAHADANGINSFAADPWNFLADYGRAAFSIRNRVFFGGNVSLPWSVQFFPMLIARSGIPFSITLGEDLVGTGNHNSRPALATPSTPAADLRVTPYGAFNIAPSSAAAMIPPNTATGPTAWTFNLRLSKTFSLGAIHGSQRGDGDLGLGGHRDRHPRRRSLGPAGLGNSLATGSGGGSQRRYALTASLAVRNVFNHPNLGVPNGDLNSPFFGQSTALSGAPYAFEDIATRMVQLGLRLDF